VTTDPDLPPGAEPAAAQPDCVSVQAATSLVVATWPLDTADVANRVKLAWLLAACARLLRPGGCLVLVVTAPAGTVAAPEDFSPVAAAAAGAGLGYLQHIVAVAADTDGDAFVYHVTDEELLALAADTERQRWAVAHLRVHADLLVFSKVQAPDRPRRKREGGGRRG
jgi:SAM-dependent methyltransferase